MPRPQVNTPPPSTSATEWLIPAATESTRCGVRSGITRGMVSCPSWASIPLLACPSSPLPPYLVGGNQRRLFGSRRKCATIV